MRVAQLASPIIVSAAASESLAEAAERMRLNDVGALPIASARGFERSVISERDIVRAVADGVEPARATVSEYMSGEAVTIASTQTVEAAAELMLEAGIRHLVVTTNGAATGIVSIRDVMDALRVQLRPDAGSDASADDAEGPSLRQMSDEPVAVVVTHGAPGSSAHRAIAALFASVAALDLASPPGHIRARWPDAHLRPQQEWTGEWALPIPTGAHDLPQPVGDVEVTTARWTYGTVAEIIHHGPYDAEAGSVARLQAFIDDEGYEIVGPHEEEYLTPPGSSDQRTIIRYRVRPKTAA